MRLLFWFSFASIVYAYAGYPLVLRAFGRRRPVCRGTWVPKVSVVIAAHNEERNLERKLASLRASTYPKQQLEVIVASDGSTDRTAEILKAASPFVTAVHLAPSQGKAAALNRAVQSASGEVLVFMDARQTVDPLAIGELVSCLTDRTVGAVSGELHLEDERGQPSPDGLGLYWKIEKLTRRLESETGSVVGVTGAIYAMRRELYQTIPAGTLLDDVLIPMQVARQGQRVLFHPGAIARDCVFVEPSKEFRRKVRTLTGNYQLLKLAPWLLTPQNPLLLRFISHKLLRLMVPLLLAFMLLSSLLAHGWFYQIAATAQIAFYVLAAVGSLSPSARHLRPVGISYTFAMLNLAAALAFYNFLAGRSRWA